MEIEKESTGEKKDYIVYNLQPDDCVMSMDIEFKPNNNEEDQ